MEVLKLIGLLLGLLLALVGFFIIVITQLLFFILIPISIIFIILDIIARKISPYIYTALMIVTVIIQRIFIDIRIPDGVDGFYGFNTPNILFFLITDIIIVVFFVLFIKSLSKSERIQRISNKINSKITKNVDKVVDYTKNDINTAFNLEKQEEEKIETLEENPKKETEVQEKETRTQIILETENKINKK